VRCSRFPMKGKEFATISPEYSFSDNLTEDWKKGKRVSISLYVKESTDAYGVLIHS